VDRWQDPGYISNAIKVVIPLDRNDPAGGTGGPVVARRGGTRGELPIYATISHPLATLRRRV
jgi:hypothetical protein